MAVVDCELNSPAKCRKGTEFSSSRTEINQLASGNEQRDTENSFTDFTCAQRKDCRMVRGITLKVGCGLDTPEQTFVLHFTGMKCLSHTAC